MKRAAIALLVVPVIALWIYGCDKPVPAEPDTDQQALFAKKCPPGTIACKGKCVDLSNDANNCGACGAKCPAGEVCQNGTCSAPTCSCEGVGMATCDGCADLDIDPDNCGSCGNECSGWYGIEVGYCLDGSCNIASCNSGFGDCDGDAATGCETYLVNDVNNCGACKFKCPERPNTNASCDYDSCVSECVLGYSECDGNPLNGCETEGSCF